MIVNDNDGNAYDAISVPAHIAPSVDFSKKRRL